MTEMHNDEKPEILKNRRNWLYDLSFVLIILIGAYFRFTGLDWDEGIYLHPDERFLAMVESSISPVNSFSEYWDTQVSSLNPNNRGHGFFVYGTLPIFFVRYVMEWAGQVGYGEVAAFGRPLAGLFDLLTVSVLYFTASKLYDRRVAVLAAAFSAFAVLQIQLSHFFTVDVFANLFIWLAIYFGAVIVRSKPVSLSDLASLPEFSQTEQLRTVARELISHPLLLPVLGFGVFTGAAAASKVSAFPVAFLLPIAAWLYVSKYPVNTRNSAAIAVFALMVLSGVLAALTFRVFQPYAFSGPGFFNILPSQIWLETIGRLQELVEPSSGYPPSVQWFDRPIWFSWQNLTVWGLGLPLGISAWVGFVWMGSLIAKRNFAPHLLIWIWVGFHFLWQSSVPNPTMRYQLPIYPGMGLMAAWGLVALWDQVKIYKPDLQKWLLPLTGSVIAFLLLSTLVYAAAFSNIYRTDVTRIAASRWIYQNLPGALNLTIERETVSYNQLQGFPDGYQVRPGEPFTVPLTAKESGVVNEIRVPHLVVSNPSVDQTALFLRISEDEFGENTISTKFLQVPLEDNEAASIEALVFKFDELVSLEAFKTYYIKIEMVGTLGSIEMCEPIPVLIGTPLGGVEFFLPIPENCVLAATRPYLTSFTPEVDGGLPELKLGQTIRYLPDPIKQSVAVTISESPAGEVISQSNVEFIGSIDDLVFELEKPFVVNKDQTYYLAFKNETGYPVAFIGSILAQETSWDDPLPMRVDGLDGFGGIYQGDNNLELYWEDNAEKIDRIVNILDKVDVIPISSSRQWGSLTRLPERWPIVEAYYRNLLGCPADINVEWCYNRALPGMFTENLGFELVKVFQSNPRLGFFEINDQYSEEAFTVYDHPKVFIFIKSDDYNSDHVRQILRNAYEIAATDLTQNQNAPIKSLLLSADRIARQENSGTWSELFSQDRFVNRSQVVAVFVWYLLVLLLGVLTYPILRKLFSGLADKGYAFGRTAALLIIAYVVWLLGSFDFEISRVFLSIVIAIFVLLGLLAWFFQRAEIKKDWLLNREYFITVELLALALFVFVLIIRVSNPDLWHPWKGGEKPMDFAYFNAVLKSQSFPPYDPWFSGGYINYYYYGFVFVGVLVRWLGIMPAVAYNLLIPTLFIMVALGSFSLAWNLMHGNGSSRWFFKDRNNQDEEVDKTFEGVSDRLERWLQFRQSQLAYLSGLAAAVGVTLIGNLGTVRMFIQGYQKVIAPPDVILEETFFLTRWLWTVQGFSRVMTTEAELPYALADWYWFPSRAIPAPGDVEPITEFPFFTFLYGDLHAHMLAIPITLLALAWSLSIIFSDKSKLNILNAGLALIFGGLIIGALRPTNTWDYPTYLSLGLFAIVYAGMKYNTEKLQMRFVGMPSWLWKVLFIVAGGLLLILISWYMYHPYTQSYALGYTEVNLWQGGRTQFSAYFTHWGLFLFVIASWMTWETREWLAHTPAASGLRYIRNHLEWIVVGIVLLVGVSVILATLKISLSYLTLFLAAWTALLMFRPGISDARRIVLFMTGSGLVLTLMVETIVLSGDIGRMNTVFKFYLQVWVLFAIAASVTLGWLSTSIEHWLNPWRRGWKIIFGALLFSAILYPLLGGFAKMEDRMAEAAPSTLDGMAYMTSASYFDQGRELKLDEDYRAIRWMQENVQGTPVIVEGQVVEYRWGSRYSVYTGLPTVLGWNWHQRQQRTGHDLEVWDRSNRVQEFYNTTNINIANRFLDEFNVKYIIVGQMERAYYADNGLKKFDAFEGRYWKETYRDGETVIYEVFSK